MFVDNNAVLNCFTHVYYKTVIFLAFLTFIILWMWSGNTVVLHLTNDPMFECSQ